MIKVGRAELSSIADIARHNVTHHKLPENLDAAQFNTYNIVNAFLQFLNNQDEKLNCEIELESAYEE